MSKLKKNIAVIALEVILFTSLIFLYTKKEAFPFITKRNFTNENVIIL